MGKLIAFNNVTLDGYFSGADGDMSWAHKGYDDAEFQAFIAGNASGGGHLLLGRVTYELMANYWPTPLAMQNDPVVAERMNNLSKVVFSTTLDKASWSNTELVKSEIVCEVRKMKQQQEEGMAILGSGSIAAQLAEAGLIDEYQIVLNPIFLGKGKTYLSGIKDMLPLKLTKTRSFANGKVFMCYQPVN